MKNKTVEDFEEAIHYLKVLQNNYSVLQPEIRKSIDNGLLALKILINGISELK